MCVVRKLKQLHIKVIRNYRLQNLCIQRPGLLQYFFQDVFLDRNIKLKWIMKGTDWDLVE